MSKVLIITNHWMDRQDNKEMNASLFADGKVYTDNTGSKRIYAQALLDMFVSFSTNTSEIYGLFGLENGDGAISDLCKLLNAILEEPNFKDEKFKNYAKKAIDNLQKDRIEAFIHKALKEHAETLNSLFSTLIMNQQPPLCYHKIETNNNEEYKVIGISSFPKNSDLGLTFRNQWVDALINDFTTEKDDVILALHGSTDWKEKDPVLGPLKEYSKEISLTKKRKIRVFLFQHYDTDSIARVLKSNESLPTLWNKLDKEYEANK